MMDDGCIAGHRGILQGFIEGDVVHVVGGGPLLTVVGTTSSGQTLCIWFNTMDELQTKEFNPGVLVLAEEA